MKKVLISAVLCGLIFSNLSIAQADILDKADNFINKAKTTRDAAKSSASSASTTTAAAKKEQISKLKAEKKAKLKEINDQISAKNKQISSIKKSNSSLLEQKKQTDKLEWEIVSLEKKADLITKTYDKRIQNLQK